ncbi:gliding motility-associated C-terminal domain-containing protein [Rhodocytophaga aerolata]|uniref:Gliding motility-associated C-terminal domain-containing protein n=1 Tax=Rhodocytophaga aerolata TaxID=455078 RepID=A0ABT8RK16_9BACT|nr:gliding motility-associated C-terminal domain-containing protein [Rhodocytophaga aerolata]
MLGQSRVFAQKEGNIWYLGKLGYGLDFNSTPAGILKDGALQNGVNGQPFTMADPCGNLLFYSDGHRVFNRQHRVMLNGDSLAGGYSFQTVVAVPHPSDDSLYYLFTQNIRPLSIPPYSALYYSIIDMRLDKGLGGVARKNTFLYQTNGQSLTAIRHANGQDYWIATVEAETNRFVAYLVNKTGLQTSPVVSQIPYTFIYTRILRASPNGKFIATNTFTGLPGSPECTLFDFNDASGRITNTRLLPIKDDYGWAMEFSPDSRKLYWIMPASLQKNQIAQFQISGESGEDIAATRYNIALSQGKNHTDLRLAPDGKIYTIAGETLMDAIENPNALGNGLMYRQGIYPISTYLFLPNNIAGYNQGKQQDFTASPVCDGEQVQFEVKLNYKAKEWLWNFGDPASGENDTSTLANPLHRFSAPGTYQVKLIIRDRCGELDTLQKPVVIYPKPVVNLPEEAIEKCFTDVPLTFSVEFLPYTSYRWNTGDTTRSIQVNQTGWYKVEAYNPCGNSRDSVYLQVIPEVKAYLPDDTIVCEGNFTVLDALNPGAAYLWNTGETTQQIQVDKPGKYYVEIHNRCSVSVDTANLVFIKEEIGAFIPNVFTPNSDGVNDTFSMHVLNTPAYSLTICNRWGKPVFYSSNPFDAWDGRADGGQVIAGVYFWFVTATDCRGNPVTYRGTVSLLQ